MNAPLLQVNDLKKHFPIYKGTIFRRQITAILRPKDKPMI